MANVGASAELYNKLVRHGTKVYLDELDRIFANWEQEGFLPGTEVPDKQEELDELRPQVPQLAQIAQATTDEFERIDALRKLQRWAQLEEELGDGTTQNPQS